MCLGSACARSSGPVVRRFVFRTSMATLKRSSPLFPRSSLSTPFTSNCVRVMVHVSRYPASCFAPETAFAHY